MYVGIYLRDIGPHFDQGPPHVPHHGFVGGVEAQGHRHHRRAYQSRQAGREVGRQNQRVQAVIRQQAEDALGPRDVQVVQVRGPKVGARVVEAEGEGLVPDGGVAVRWIVISESALPL